MAPSNETLDERTQRMQDDITDIKDIVKEIKKGQDDFMAETRDDIKRIEKDYIPRDEANKTFANIRLQRVLIGVGSVAGLGVLGLIGDALLGLIKNAS